MVDIWGEENTSCNLELHWPYINEQGNRSGTILGEQCMIAVRYHGGADIKSSTLLESVFQFLSFLFAVCVMLGSVPPLPSRCCV